MAHLGIRVPNSSPKRGGGIDLTASGNRSSDVMHVSCAQLAELTVFASFDARQRKLAESVGLRLAPVLLDKV